jgi:hypothetical protein
MHKHEGIVVVAFKPGQPSSQIQADLMLADIGDFTTSMVNLSSGDYGIGAKVNLADEALALMDDLQDAGFSVSILQGESPAYGWRVL